MNIKKNLKILTLFLTISIGTGYLLTRSHTIKPQTNEEFAKVTVMITNYGGRSGGSGVILTSKRGQSTILTNKHVCGVIEHGGFVSTDDKRGMVQNYKTSEEHDLCLITVNTNFKVNTVLADNEPAAYDDSIVSGHPHLISTIVTHGHFGKKEFVTIMTGTRKCTEEEKQGPEGLVCMLLGGIPEIKKFEAQIASNTIQPGSSGSGVFNNKGELSGLVFAGSGDFGYALIVPYEYVANFVENELPSLTLNKPSENVDTNGIGMNANKNWKRICVLDNTSVQRVCTLLDQTLIKY